MDESIAPKVRWMVPINIGYLSKLSPKFNVHPRIHSNSSSIHQALSRLFLWFQPRLLSPQWLKPVSFKYGTIQAESTAAPKTRDEWNIWGSKIKRILHIDSLQSLVDWSDLPRQTPDDPAYAKWRKPSLYIWLLSTARIDTWIMMSIIKSNTPDQYADELFKATMSATIGEAVILEVQTSAFDSLSQS
jgi:hypothetical protein